MPALLLRFPYVGLVLSDHRAQFSKRFHIPGFPEDLHGRGIVFRGGRVHTHQPCHLRHDLAVFCVHSLTQTHIVPQLFRQLRDPLLAEKEPFDVSGLFFRGRIGVFRGKLLRLRCSLVQGFICFFRPFYIRFIFGV